MLFRLPYGRSFLMADIPEQRLSTVVENRLSADPDINIQKEIVLNAMRHPYGSAPLHELARGKNNIVIIASDHTRPVPSKILIPIMLNEIHEGNPDAKVSILIATGCHRGTTKDELIAKFGKEIVDRINIKIHDCADDSQLTDLGTLPSGGKLKINKTAVDADLLISEGFIEPHFFAGYSGGRKSVLPGIASRETVYYNHNAAFINAPHSRAGQLKDNPIHRDMVYAAHAAKLCFILNVVLDGKKNITAAFAGDVEQAHRAGTDYVWEHCASVCSPSDIVISTNNGYPLDQNVYQSVKGMSTAEPICRPGGVIIMLAACEDGLGGDSFYRTFRDDPSAESILQTISKVPADKTIPDQWQSQIFARILLDHPIIFISEVDDRIVREMHMVPAHSISEALVLAEQYVGRGSSIAVIPEGISSITALKE